MRNLDFYGVDHPEKTDEVASATATAAVASYIENQRVVLQKSLVNATGDEQYQIQQQINDINNQERVMNVLIGAVTGTIGATLTQAGLSEAADKMRQLMVEDSKTFAGVTMALRHLATLPARGDLELPIFPASRGKTVAERSQQTDFSSSAPFGSDLEAGEECLDSHIYFVESCEMKKIGVLMAASAILANSGCALGFVAPLDAPKPYLTTWNKVGLTREGRMQDSALCGGGYNERVVVNAQNENAVPRSDEKYQQTDSRLFRQWQRCMIKKGYRYTGVCCDNEISRTLPACGAP